jgi:hypothetical protein
MNRPSDLFDPRIASWLEDDPAHAPDQVLETVLAAIPSIPQKRVALRVPWRFSSLMTPARAAASIAAVFLVVAGGLVLASRPAAVGTPTTPPTFAPPSPVQPTPAAPTPAATRYGPLDGTSWTTEITGADTLPGIPRIPVGTWTLKFVAEFGGSFLDLGTKRGNGTSNAVTYQGSDEIALPADTACASDSHQSPGPGTSIYRYSVEGNTLRFTLVTTDSCIPRMVNLTKHPWTRAATPSAGPSGS